jgi:hypothetical protein
VTFSRLCTKCTALGCSTSYRTTTPTCINSRGIACASATSRRGARLVTPGLTPILRTAARHDGNGRLALGSRPTGGCKTDSRESARVYAPLPRRLPREKGQSCKTPCKQSVQFRRNVGHLITTLVHYREGIWHFFRRRPQRIVSARTFLKRQYGITR